MRVTFEWPIKTLSGKSPDGTVVFQSYNNDNVCIMRKYVRPRITDHNREYGTKFKKIALLYRTMPEDFKDSLRVYAQAYNRQLLPEKKLPLNFYNILIKALCKKAVSLSDLDSMENIVEKFGGTIEEWIENGLLDKVKGKSFEISFRVPVVQFTGLGFPNLVSDDSNHPVAFSTG